MRETYVKPYIFQKGPFEGSDGEMTTLGLFFSLPAREEMQMRGSGVRLGFIQVSGVRGEGDI